MSTLNSVGQTVQLAVSVWDQNGQPIPNSASTGQMATPVSLPSERASDNRKEGELGTQRPGAATVDDEGFVAAVMAEVLRSPPDPEAFSVMSKPWCWVLNRTVKLSRLQDKSSGEMSGILA